MDSTLDVFIDIVQWSGSREEAAAIVNAAGGDIALAVSLFYEADAPATPEYVPVESIPESHGQQRRRPTEPTSLQEQLSIEYKRDLVKSPLRRISDGNVSYAIKIFGLSRLLCVVDSVVSWVLGGLSPFVATLTQAVFGVSPRTPSEARSMCHGTIVEPVLQGLDACNQFEMRILSGVSFNEALEVAKASLDFLLVVIVSEVHESSASEFLRNLLKTEVARDLRVRIWLGSALSVEGQRVLRTLDVSGLPVVQLVGASPKTADSNVLVMEQLFTAVGFASLSSQSARGAFSDRVKALLEVQEPKLLSLRLNRQQYNSDRMIREDQDNAYQRSLDQDREKSRLAREREESLQKEHDAAVLEELTHSAWEAAVARRAATYSLSSSVPGSARVSMRLSSGERLDIRIAGDAPIRALFDIVYAHVHALELVASGDPSGDSCAVSGSYAPYNLQLISTVKREQLYPDLTPVRDSEAVWPSGVLMVDIE